MTNSKELFNDLVSRITLKEEKSEIQSIVYLLLEKKLRLTKTEIIAGKETTAIDPVIFNESVNQINNHMPIQYILGEVEFYGRIFQVNPSVLIPRPETELLVHEIRCEFLKPGSKELRILDIGTGSGCISISLALEIPRATVHATDISKEALSTAQQNAQDLHAQVCFHEHNILADEISFGPFDLVVSNPPYVSPEEKTTMKQNVLMYEPHLALFAPAEDPLAFYKSIASKSRTVLHEGGSVWLEINEHFGDEVCHVFTKSGYQSVRMIKDFDNKNRIVTAIR
jgi:release factor glutamine methyltransferase